MSAVRNYGVTTIEAESPQDLAIEEAALLDEGGTVHFMFHADLEDGRCARAYMIGRIPDWP